MRSPHAGGERLPRPKPKNAIEHRFADEARFIKAWFDNPLKTGAVSPSGKVLSRTMAQAVDPAVEGPIVELGPGTGPVTEALIQRGVRQDRLILIEFDPDFCRLLKRRYPRAKVVEGDAYALARALAPVLDEKAAAIVSSLPLLTKPERQRLDLLEEAFELLGPRGIFVQFTYGLTSPVPRVDENFRPTGFRAEVSPPVWLNLPPARVWTYRPPTTDEAGDDRAASDILLKLKAGTDKIGDEFREKRERLHREFVVRAEKAKAEFKARTEKVKFDIQEHQARVLAERERKEAMRLVARMRKDRKPPW